MIFQLYHNCQVC